MLAGILRRGTLHTVGRSVISAAMMENTMERPLKTKNSMNVWSSRPSAVCTSTGMKSYHQRNTCTPHIYGSTNLNSQHRLNGESANRWVDKENVSVQRRTYAWKCISPFLKVKFCAARAANTGDPSTFEDYELEASLGYTERSVTKEDRERTHTHLCHLQQPEWNQRLLNGRSTGGCAPPVTHLPACLLWLTLFAPLAGFLYVSSWVHGGILDQNEEATFRDGAVAQPCDGTQNITVIISKYES